MQPKTQANTRPPAPTPLLTTAAEIPEVSLGGIRVATRVRRMLLVWTLVEILVETSVVETSVEEISVETVKNKSVFYLLRLELRYPMVIRRHDLGCYELHDLLSEFCRL